MIRYKKRKFQQGGASPATDFAQGAAAQQAAGGAPLMNPYKRSEMPIDSQGGGSRGGSGGGGVGKGLFNNLMNTNGITSDYVPNTAASYNKLLDEKKQELIDNYTVNDLYFETTNGLKKLNEYKALRQKYESEVGSVEKLYINAQKKIGDNFSKYAFTSNNEVFVFNEEGKLELIPYNKLTEIRESKKGEELGNTYIPLTAASVLESIDDPSVRSAISRQRILEILGTMSDDKVVAGVLKDVKKNVYKDYTYDKARGFIGPDGKIKVSKEDIENYNSGGEPTKELKRLLDNFTQNNEVVNYFTEETIKRSESGGLQLKPNQDFSSVVDRQILKHIIDFANVGASEMSAEEITRLNTERDAVMAYALDNEYNKAESGISDLHSVELDIMQGFDKETGEFRKDEGITEHVLTTNLAYVPQSASDIQKNSDAILANDNIKKENVTIDKFSESITRVADTENAVYLDGTPVQETNFSDGRSGYVPVVGEQMEVVTLIVDKNTGKLATWAIPIIDELKNNTDKIVEESRNQDLAIDSSLVDRVEKSNKELYNSLIQAVGVKSPPSYEGFFTAFKYKNFYKIKVVGSVDLDEPFKNEQEFNALETITDNLSNSAIETAELFGINTFWDRTDDVVQTAILAPARGLAWSSGASGSAKTKGNKGVIEALKKIETVNIKSLVSPEANKHLEGLILENAQALAAQDK